MSSIRLRRLVAALGLAGWIALLPAAASAGSAAEPFQLLPERGLLAAVWDFVAGLVGVDGEAATETGAPGQDLLNNGDQGASVDPNGRS